MSGPHSPTVPEELFWEHPGLQEGTPCPETSPRLLWTQVGEARSAPRTCWAPASGRKRRSVQPPPVPADKALMDA